MIATLDRMLLAEVSGLIAARMGLHFPEERWPDLARGLNTAGPELGFHDLETCARWLVTRELTVRQTETLASHLTVGETYLFRDPASFEILEQNILPPIVAKRAEASRTLRLWSAGCCTGEEAYSLAISCARALPDVRAWNVSILATDINPKFLARAAAGVYSEWSFRGTPAWVRERFFSPKPDKKLAIDRGLQALVRFGYLNLAEDAYPSLHTGTNAMDVIFCRNVLMYFTLEHQRRVVAALHHSLVDGGYLFVNPAEASASLFPMFAQEHADGVILYRKTTRPTDYQSWPTPVMSTPINAAPVLDPAHLVVPAPAQPVMPVDQVAPKPPAAPMPETGCASTLTAARVYANEGKLEEARMFCEQAIAAERTNLAAYFLCATICHELGRVEEAVTALNKVLYLDQDFILAHHALGDLHRRLGNQKESKRHLGIALKLLAARSRDEIVPESDGMTCGRLLESVRAMAGA
jgi:chemotaxis protein methyltransferase CheR